MAGLQSRQGADDLVRVRDGKIPLVVKVTFLAPAQGELDDAVAGTIGKRPG